MPAMTRERDTKRTGRRWALAGAIAVVAAVIALPRCGDDRAEIEADLEALAAQVGTPLPDMVGDLDCCRRGYSERFYTEPAASKLIAWFAELPDRMACESFEISDLDLPSGGYAEWYEFKCTTKRNGRAYEVRVRSIAFPLEDWTTIAVDHAA